MFEGLIVGVNWCIFGYRNDVSDLIDYDDYILKYYNEGKVWIKGVEVIVNFDIGLLMYIVSYDYVDVCNVIIDMLLLCRVK